MTYLIDYQKELNPAQYEAATALTGPMLVIAGAGSGKTRTIVYRLARLLEEGVPTHKILLLTFTRKASAEMIRRAEQLLGYSLGRIQGGTFHSFAYTILRQFRPQGYERELSIMDTQDMLFALAYCKEALAKGKGDRSFPKNQTIARFISKARNKEYLVEELIQKEVIHLLAYAKDISHIFSEYTKYKQEHCLLDYDDLLFKLEEVLSTREDVLLLLREHYTHIMVDEYQDTNMVQARIISLLAGNAGNVMVVGDDAQSIYAFRGASVENILAFTEIFEQVKVIKLEENYRSIQPILDLTNNILLNSKQGFSKNLYTKKAGSDLPLLIKPQSDLSQADMVVAKIKEWLYIYEPYEIAVLFRAGYQSYHIELQLNKEQIAFCKYGGLRYSEAAHIKDMLSLLRLILNPLDLPSFSRVAAFFKGIGPKTTQRLFIALTNGEEEIFAKTCKKYPEFFNLLQKLMTLKAKEVKPSFIIEEVINLFNPLLELIYPDDYPYRLQAVTEFLQISESYTDLDLFVSDLSLDSPEPEAKKSNSIVLSTIHSAKGLEWKAVIIIDLVEDRFPSRHALLKADEFEEERRLLYVACTRAKDTLVLFAPLNIFQRSSGSYELTRLSPFLNELSSTLFEEYKQSFAKNKINFSASESINNKNDFTAFNSIFGSINSTDTDNSNKKNMLSSLKDIKGTGYCYNKVFGRGKIIQFIPPNKYRVNFSGFGTKVILVDYLTMEL